MSEVCLVPGMLVFAIHHSGNTEWLLVLSVDTHGDTLRFMRTYADGTDRVIITMGCGLHRHMGFFMGWPSMLGVP